MADIAPISEAPAPAPVGRSAGIGRASQNVLVRFAVDVFNRVRDSLSDLIRHAIERTMESLERPLISMVGPLIDDMLAVPELPDSYRAVLQSARSGEHQAGVLALGGVAVAVVTMLLPAMLSGLMERVRQRSWDAANANVLDFSTWFAAVRRDAAWGDQMGKELRRQGWTDAQVDAAILATEGRLGVNDLLTAMHRGVIPAADVLTRLRASGVNAADGQILIDLAERMPGAGDLVRYAVREAWRDDVAQRWGTDQARPGEFDQRMEDLGFPLWVSQAEWRSHWQLPSIGLAFELMHRGEVSEDDLRGLLRMQDISPGWVQPIINAARPLPGRIDRRWAFEEGIIDESELMDLYRKDGMDDRWAGIMVQMVVSRTASTAKGLTRASIVAAYGKRRLGRPEAVDLLSQIGIQAGVAAWFLDQADFDRSVDVLDRRIDAVGLQYNAALISENDALEQLGALGVGDEERRLTVDEWRLKRRVTIKRPTRANLDEFYKQGVISPDQYRDQLDLSGYDPLYVGWYLASLSVESAIAASAEQAKVRAESDRIETDVRSTEYAISKARLDQEISELNAAIADRNLALVESQNERDRALESALSAVEVAALERQYRPVFNLADEQIAQARLSIESIRGQIQKRQTAVNALNRNLKLGRDLVAEATIKSERLAHQTTLTRYDKDIARRRTNIARLEEAILAGESPDERGAIELEILGIRTQIREIQESQTDVRIAVDVLDELLPVDLGAERETAVRAEVAELQAEIDVLRVEINDMEEAIRMVQAERVTEQSELDAALMRLPGRAEQITIRAEYDNRADAIRSQIAAMRANVAALRVRKSTLAVEWRG